ncbi:MAG: hypothetical protein B6D37_15095 [Sphingobacteriales bacterium UTBCD1]|nr:MAG: hypothetical protein B6D37_15095 [Sphingobacteriales bacterium UTBCD1]
MFSLTVSGSSSKIIHLIFIVPDLKRVCCSTVRFSIHWCSIPWSVIQCTLPLPFLDEENCLEVVRTAIAQLDSPDIINSDQGSQLTCRQYVGYFKGNGITISMDGKGRALDNIYIERSWRSIKYQHIHLFPSEDGISLYLGI